MKKTEIEQGAEYVSSRSNDYNFQSYGINRVKVVGEPYLVPPAGHWERRGKTRVPVLVWSEKDQEWGDKVNNIETRHIREPWAPYAERKEAHARANADSRARRRQAQDERAARLLQLIPALRHAGVPDTEARLHRKAATASLLQHIPEDIEEVDHENPILSHRVLRAPLAASIENYVEEGRFLQIDAETLLRAIR